jgi:hypothetical protein
MSESTDTPGQTDSSVGETATGTDAEELGGATPEGESATGKDSSDQADQ